MKTASEWASEINDAPYSDRTIEQIVNEIRAEALREAARMAHDACCEYCQDRGEVAETLTAKADDVERGQA